MLFTYAHNINKGRRESIICSFPWLKLPWVSDHFLQLAVDNFLDGWGCFYFHDKIYSEHGFMRVPEIVLNGGFDDSARVWIKLLFFFFTCVQVTHWYFPSVLVIHRSACLWANHSTGNPSSHCVSVVINNIRICMGIIKCLHFVFIVHFLLLCRDFRSFTVNFNYYLMVQQSLVYILLLKGFNKNKAHGCNTNDFLIEISLGL